MNTAPTPQRLLSLDVFRGMTIAAMILVNNPGSFDDIYPQLRHAEWHGWTMTDWIFPFFLWIVGLAATLSVERRRERGDLPGQLLLHAVRRSIILFALGLFLNGFPFGLFPHSEFTWSTLRIPGVLQRIAVCYFAAHLILTYSSAKSQVIWTSALLAGHWLLLMLVPVPGFGTGILEPKGSLEWYIDSAVLGNHTWKFAPVPGFDPEGIVSTLPAIATTLIGVLTGHMIRKAQTKGETVGRMLVAGFTLTVAGIVLDQWLPINKNLWTAPYVLFTAGLAFLCLGSLFWLIEVKDIRRWFKPFAVFGMNAITVYALSELVWSLLWAVALKDDQGSLRYLHDALFETVFAPLASTRNASLLFAVVYTLAMGLPAWLMWKKKWFVKL